MLTPACFRQLQFNVPDFHYLWSAKVTDEQRRQILSRLNGRSEVDAFEAAKAIWEDSDKRLEGPLILILKKGHKPFNRAAAAYAMQMVTTSRTITALEGVIRNKSERPRVRGEAAEALAHRHRKESHDVLLAGLADPSKELRFWCAFALGEMAERRAATFLERLVTTDKRVVRGWHSVAEEAADALKSIKAARKDYQRGRCPFCIGK